jgi:repressor LexA
MELLNPKEKIVLEAITNFQRRENKIPTVRELQEEVKHMGLNFKSSRSIFLYLSSLEKKGVIRRKGMARGIKIKSSEGFIDVPILGSANAGTPTIFAEENVEGFLKISKRFMGERKLFAIKISGTSMNSAEINGKKIESGDYAIIDPSIKNFVNNDKVLAVLDGLATVKIYRKIKKDLIALFPSSTDQTHKPIYITPQDDFIINGKVVDVLKGETSLF